MHAGHLFGDAPATVAGGAVGGVRLAVAVVVVLAGIAHQVTVAVRLVGVGHQGAVVGELGDAVTVHVHRTDHPDRGDASTAGHRGSQNHVGDAVGVDVDRGFEMESPVLVGAVNVNILVRIPDLVLSRKRKRPEVDRRLSRANKRIVLSVGGACAEADVICAVAVDVPQLDLARLIFGFLSINHVVGVRQEVCRCRPSRAGFVYACLSRVGLPVVGSIRIDSPTEDLRHSVRVEVSRGQVVRVADSVKSVRAVDRQIGVDKAQLDFRWPIRPASEDVEIARPISGVTWAVRAAGRSDDVDSAVLIEIGGTHVDTHEVGLLLPPHGDIAVTGEIDHCRPRGASEENVETAGEEQKLLFAMGSITGQDQVNQAVAVHVTGGNGLVAATVVRPGAVDHRSGIVEEIDGAAQSRIAENDVSLTRGILEIAFGVRQRSAEDQIVGAVPVEVAAAQPLAEVVVAPFADDPEIVEGFDWKDAGPAASAAIDHRNFPRLPSFVGYAGCSRGADDQILDTVAIEVASHRFPSKFVVDLGAVDTQRIGVRRQVDDDWRLRGRRAENACSSSESCKCVDPEGLCGNT
ncbi:MAG: hypothetical protein Q9Q13_04450 [Acidobacteriota bacterium]|nr:hypothetical protein [Acidobacteriota bacterium]